MKILPALVSVGLGIVLAGLAPGCSSGGGGEGRDGSDGGLDADGMGGEDFGPGCMSDADCPQPGICDLATHRCGSCNDAPIGEPILIPLIATGTRVTGLSGGPNFQEATNTVTIPAGCYLKITARVRLTGTCSGSVPPGQNWPPLCDPFDRTARLDIGDGKAPSLFLVDGMSPFGGEAAWEQEITDYAPALFGAHTYHLVVTTGADPAGHATGTQAGWDVEAEMVLTPGPLPREVAAVVPVFLDGRCAAGSLPISQTVTAPEGASSARIDFYTTGHGADGNPPCDEFCKKKNVLRVDGAEIYSDTPWTFCAGNCAAQSPSRSFSCMGQSFNYLCAKNPTGCPASVILDRAGWCPGEKVELRSFDLPAAVATGSHVVEFNIENMPAGAFWQVGAAVVFFR